MNDGMKDALGYMDTARSILNNMNYRIMEHRRKWFRRSMMFYSFILLAWIALGIIILKYL